MHLVSTDTLYIYIYTHYYLKGFPYLDSSFFSSKNAPTSLCLNRDKIKGQSGKNTTLTFTKTLPKIPSSYPPTSFQLMGINM